MKIKANIKKESIWAGASEDAFFSADVFDHNRTIQRAEYAYSNNIGKTGYYVLGVDIGRKSDNAVIVVIKVNPQGNDDAIKNVVNIYSYNQMHFEDLCIEAKRIFKRFKPRMMVVDGNGMGTGFVDYLVKDQIDPVSGELLPNMGIANDEPGIYKQFKTKDTILDSVYVIKATAQLNTEMHAHISNQMRMNKVKFLIDEREAKERLLGLDKGQKMSLDQRAEELRPYVVTSIMKEELLTKVRQIHFLIAGSPLELKQPNYHSNIDSGEGND